MWQIMRFLSFPGSNYKRAWVPHSSFRLCSALDLGRHGRGLGGLLDGLANQVDESLGRARQGLGKASSWLGNGSGLVWEGLRDNQGGGLITYIMLILFSCPRNRQLIPR